MIAAAVNILLNYMLIPSYGYKIAAWTTLASYGLLFVLHYLTSRYYLKYDKLKLKSVLPDFVFLIVIFILYFPVNGLPFSYISVLLIKALVFVSASVYLFWKNIKQHLLKNM